MGNHFDKTHPFQPDHHNVVEVDFFAPSTPPSQVGLEAWKNSDAEDAKGPKNSTFALLQWFLGDMHTVYTKNPLFSKLVESDIPVLSKTLKYKTYLLMIHIHDGQQVAAYLAIATYPRSYCSLAPPIFLILILHQTAMLSGLLCHCQRTHRTRRVAVWNPKRWQFYSCQFQLTEKNKRNGCFTDTKTWILYSSRYWEMMDLDRIYVYIYVFIWFFLWTNTQRLDVFH